MTEINRRAAIVGVVAGAGTAIAGPGESQEQTDQKSADETYVIAAGMTDDEAKSWRLIAEAAAAFFALPEIHSMDKHEVASAVHVIQNKLLSRPTYRKYLEIAKAGAKGKEEK